jgi:hypothetical protein
MTLTGPDLKEEKFRTDRAIQESSLIDPVLLQEET